MIDFDIICIAIACLIMVYVYADWRIKSWHKDDEKRKYKHVEANSKELRWADDVDVQIQGLTVKTWLNQYGNNLDALQDVLQLVIEHQNNAITAYDWSNWVLVEYELQDRLKFWLNVPVSPNNQPIRPAAMPREWRDDYERKMYFAHLNAGVAPYIRPKPNDTSRERFT